MKPTRADKVSFPITYRRDSRYYRLHIQTDLIGAHVLIAEWGNQQRAQGAKRYFFSEPSILTSRLRRIDTIRRYLGFRLTQGTLPITVQSHYPDQG